MHVQEQQLRSQALQPFIVAPPSRGIVGTSRFAQRMKAQVMQAAKDPTGDFCPNSQQPSLCSKSQQPYCHALNYEPPTR
jgi:hypothetical protein